MHWEILEQLLVGEGFDAFWSTSQWAFDHLNSQHTGQFHQNFSKTSNAQGEEGGGMGGFGIDRFITLTNKTVTELLRIT